uniref:Uncharacterized protein n=1 Tax=Cucumis melo TaxID=3656 RepID=A0A9I9EG36_CUCME
MGSYLARRRRKSESFKDFNENSRCQKCILAFRFSGEEDCASSHATPHSSLALCLRLSRSLFERYTQPWASSSKHSYSGTLNLFTHKRLERLQTEYQR